MNRKIIAAAVLSVAAAGCSAQSATTTTSGGAKVVKPALDQDVRHVANEVEVVQTEVGIVATGHTTQDDINQLAVGAQQAHDDLANMKDQIAVDSPAGSNVGGELFGAVDELKNAMGALVAYTGDPNAATLAHFTTQWQTGAADWNQAVGDLYSGTSQTAPTIKTS